MSRVPRKTTGDLRLDERKIDIPRRATASRPAPERIYKPRRGLNDISVFSKSRYGPSLSRNRGVNLANAGLYDVASAYPSIAVQLPSTESGKWVRKINPTRDEIEKSNILSMFKVRTRGFATDLPFYPLPFRTERKSIMFPPEIFAGRYMRDDVIAAFEYADRFTELKQLAHWG